MKTLGGTAPGGAPYSVCWYHPGTRGEALAVVLERQDVGQDPSLGRAVARRGSSRRDALFEGSGASWKLWVVGVTLPKSSGRAAQYMSK